MKNISIYILSTEECYTLNERLLGVFKTHLAEESVINDVLPYLNDLNRDLSARLSKNNSNLLTKELVAKDQLRNAAFTGFRDYCKAFTNVKDSVKSEAAKKIGRVDPEGRLDTPKSGIHETHRFAKGLK